MEGKQVTKPINQAAPTTTTRTLEALGAMLREHYGTWEGDHDRSLAMVENYAALWDSLLTTLENNANDTNFHELLDEKYIELATK